MLTLRLFNRNDLKTIYPLFNKLKFYCSSSESDNKDKTKEKTKNNEALDKLNLLLKRMIEEPPKTIKSDLKLAKPKPKIRNAKTEPGTVSVKAETIEQRITNAARDVAESLGGNKKQTESELLSKLLNQNSANLDSDKNKPINLSDLISGMKIDRTVQTDVNTDVSRAHQVRKLLDQTTGRTKTNLNKSVSSSFRTKRKPSLANFEKIDLFGSEPLGIFTLKTKELKQNSIKLETWNDLQTKELRLAVTHPPENYFQEMILWTEQGKVWKFPIDNEQGLEEEQNVYFAEHIFLDKYLENWCPTKGPIRHFMELVCVGLSKNPYLSVEAKKDHILWYKDYFLSKKQLLEEIGAISLKTNE